MSRSASARVKMKLKALATRITRNRLTFVFFLFGFIHCFAQGIIQSFLFTIDSEYSAFFTAITKAADIPSKNHTDLHVTGRHYKLQMCDKIPHDDLVCSYIFDSEVNIQGEVDADHNAKLRGLQIQEMLRRQNITIQTLLPLNDTDNKIILRAESGDVPLSKQCTSILVYPQQHMQNSQREDIAFVLLQFWLFGISFMAMVYDSVPHVLAGLGARVLLTAWSAYALWRSKWQELVYGGMIETPGTPCSVEMFAGYFKARLNYEIIDLVLNCTALIISCYLSLTLLRLYNVESFNYMGAPKKIVRIQRYFMAVKVCLQLEAFVLLMASGLWVDQLLNSYIKDLTDHFTLYVGIFISFTIVLVPWLITGWYGIRHEHRLATGMFVALGFIFFAASCIMFYSQVYRWTFYAWPNMGCFTTASIILFLASFVLGLLCRLNFGQGLSQYLHAEAALASSNFAPEVFERDVEKNKTSLDDLKEKRGFELPIPTFHTVPTLPR
ncbi:hypothetical protein WG66_014612 [Moniliophthora roreri]|uniref:Uncharacterized protein n=1 Tax=Moniliophthora roreri TaxID=221103 RepID=A0A0W0FHG6_MONRR|nr:hypothetical protein WG66_014612 [Moniliophthora roreri]